MGYFIFSVKYFFIDELGFFTCSPAVERYSYKKVKDCGKSRDKKEEACWCTHVLFLYLINKIVALNRGSIHIFSYICMKTTLWYSLEAP